MKASTSIAMSSTEIYFQILNVALRVNGIKVLTAFQKNYSNC
jgi:hypothetical protein